MTRGTVHDLVQWIFELEQANTLLQQRIAALEKELATVKAKANGIPE